MGGVEGDWKKRLTEETIAYGIAVDKQLTQRVLKDPLVSSRIKKCRRRLVELPRNCQGLAIVFPRMVSLDGKPSTTVDEVMQCDKLRVIHLTEVHNVDDIARLRSEVERRLEQTESISLEANVTECAEYTVGDKAATHESLGVSEKSMESSVCEEPRKSKLRKAKQVASNNDMVVGEALASAIVVSFMVTTDYDSMTVQQVLQRILPSGVVIPGSFETIGHIAHLNLLPEHSEYKKTIGQVIIDKIPSIKTVVNKVHNLDNQFRNCPLELLAGEDKYDTYHYENGMRFFIDYKHVFWNSRLAGERDRIVKVIPCGAHVYDVMGGVGGFGVYLAKLNKCHVVSNDLNKWSYECAVVNIKLNKVKHLMGACNMDGRKFIREMINPRFNQSCLRNTTRTFVTDEQSMDEEEGEGRPEEEEEGGPVEENNTTITTLRGSESQDLGDNKRRRIAQEHKVYFLMNLPAIAIQFLDAFVGSIDLQLYEDHPGMVQPHVFTYCFASPADHIKTIRQRLQAPLQIQQLLQEGVFHGMTSDQILDQIILDVEEVRNVAPNKSQYCIHLCLPFQILTASQLPGGLSDRSSATNDLPSSDKSLPLSSGAHIHLT